ncbi:FMN-dependent NADH-azoreductase [Roseovarius sp.]|uniref:FMN-dependent NADH-azoreductase n=1 Tax=Roseovarius sp. TaxID=1486281 RepID=UPI003BAB44E7
MTHTILHIDTSARHTGSVSRDLSARIVADHPGARVITRDLADAPLPQITEDWVAANFTPADSRTPAQQAVLAQSDALVAELKQADTVVIGLPVYNFNVPTALKAWIDLVARVGLTFRYTENGPVGLLAGKRVIVALASGGTEAGSDIDHATPYLKFILGFMGITDVTMIAADRLGIDAEASMDKALAQLAELRTAA